ncbi:MAG: sugar phosphate nucleotidyltransferase [Bacteroidales bacterium]|nr:sugar phosphate nucleotidyltransferase [Bacteroidales bacterium]MCM1146318.1 sugar phosphate nucleotidyltransferase [Bacteroidales bacterium]MCM1205244.1 sugar phosphate nucleotidyltransferase [Bacillota bacterium]MCM1509671.1 sugar phosphate nucleotidyltransferase [Clostridium sp.]
MKIQEDTLLRQSGRTAHYYCLILAGGRGRRLWPVSREEKPKQFLDLFGTGNSLLQRTYERFINILPEENIYVSTYADYEDIVRTQLPQLSDERLLCEPIRRNTAPIVAWATHRINARDIDATMIVTPADQMILDDEAFRDDVIESLGYASRHERLLTMGIRPTRPEPGYGYIQKGEPLEYGEGRHGNFYTVQSFTEKPEREFAEMFMKSGEFLWNTGLYVLSTKTVRDHLAAVMPSVARLFGTTEGASALQEEAWITDYYSMCPNLSMETGVLEKCKDICLRECHFGWADIGAWHGIYEAVSTDSRANVTLSTDAVLSDTEGCLVILPSGRKAVINGLKDFIVAEHDDILLITPRCDNSSQIVKTMTRYNGK